MIRLSKVCSSVAVGRAQCGIPARRRWRDRRHQVPNSAVYVQIGGRSETLYKRHGAGGGFSALESRLLDQEGGNDPWTICNTGASRWGWAANRTRSGIGNESTHCRTGTRGMT